jgi:hypothetical protein
MADTFYMNRIIPSREKTVLVDMIVSRADNFRCTHRLCDDCREKTAIQPINVPTRIITYYEWETCASGRAVTCQQVCFLQIDALENQY